MNTRLTQKEMMDRYSSLMGEIRTRIDRTIIPCLARKTGLDRPIEWEICYVQLRKICELIALSCLIAHGDIGKVHERFLSKAWNPNDIMKELQKLHPKFFPIPADQQKRNGLTHFTRGKPGYLTKDDLLKIYGAAGDALHSGNLRSIAKQRRVVKLNFDEIDAWTKQIILLLRVHFILPLHGKGGLICILNDATKDDDVTVYEFEKIVSPDGAETSYRRL
jgi:hypothetical protein